MRVLILSNRDEDPLRVDSVAPVASSVVKILKEIPYITAIHQTIFYKEEVVSCVQELKPDVVFNLCEELEGDSGKEPHVAWLLDRMRQPFTGSPHKALRNCLYKVRANHMLAKSGVKVPWSIRSYTPNNIPDVIFPVIVKPEREDGSLGIESSSVVYNTSSLYNQVARVVDIYKQPACIQQYIPGREFSVSILGNRVFSPGEIVFDNLPEGHPHILTFSSKWHSDSIDWKCSKSLVADIEGDKLRSIVSIGTRAFEALGLEGYGRVDIRMADEPYVIDVNPNCDISEDGGFCLAAAREGLTHSDVVLGIIDCAKERFQF